MVFETAMVAVVVSVSWLLAVSTFWAGLRGIRFGFKDNSDTRKFCLIADFLLYPRERPLVNLLIALFGKLRTVADTFEVSNHYRIRLRSLAVGYKA